MVPPPYIKPEPSTPPRHNLNPHAPVYRPAINQNPLQPREPTPDPAAVAATNTALELLSLRLQGSTIKVLPPSPPLTPHN